MPAGSAQLTAWTASSAALSGSRRYGTELSSDTTTPEKRVLLTNLSVSRVMQRRGYRHGRIGVNHRLQFAVADRGFERRGVQVVKLVRTQKGCGGLRPPSHADYPTKCLVGAATPVV